MWNLTRGNTKMNHFECLMDYKNYLERLSQTRTVLDTKTPQTPSFILKKMIEPGSRMERALKIKYENEVIYKRMQNLMNKKSPYHPTNTAPSKCPAYELLSYHRLKKNKSIKKENNKLHNRYMSAKPTYNTQKLNDEYNYSKYLQKNISQNKNFTNPNLDFIGFNSFNKKLFGNNNSSKKVNNDSSLNNSLEYNGSYCSTQRINNNSNYNKNDEWFKNNKTQNAKLKRPNSCKPNIIIPEIPKYSETLDLYNSPLSKNYGTKPTSSRTRTNGSSTTNPMTMLNTSS